MESSDERLASAVGRLRADFRSVEVRGVASRLRTSDHGRLPWTAVAGAAIVAAVIAGVLALWLGVPFGLTFPIVFVGSAALRLTRAWPYMYITTAEYTDAVNAHEAFEAEPVINLAMPDGESVSFHLRADGSVWTFLDYHPPGTDPAREQLALVLLTQHQLALGAPLWTPWLGDTAVSTPVPARVSSLSLERVDPPADSDPYYTEQVELPGGERVIFYRPDALSDLDDVTWSYLGSDESNAVAAMRCAAEMLTMRQLEEAFSRADHPMWKHSPLTLTFPALLIDVERRHASRLTGGSATADGQPAE